MRAWVRVPVAALEDATPREQGGRLVGAQDVDILEGLVLAHVEDGQVGLEEEARLPAQG